MKILNTKTFFTVIVFLIQITSLYSFNIGDRVSRQTYLDARRKNPYPIFSPSDKVIVPASQYNYKTGTEKSWYTIGEIVCEIPKEPCHKTEDPVCGYEKNYTIRIDQYRTTIRLSYQSIAKLQVIS